MQSQGASLLQRHLRHTSKAITVAEESNTRFSKVTGSYISCPVIACIIALMLEADPNLRMPNVQLNLALTTTVTDPYNSKLITNTVTSNSMFEIVRVDPEHAINVCKTCDNVVLETY